MPEQLIYYITTYGYLAIFILVLLQELGVPNPIPVELLLFFTGYLAFKGLLSLPFIFITCITADFIGANILYIIFYFSGTYLIQKKPVWIPISEKKITRFKERITTGGLVNIYLFRLISLTRGYTSIVVGLLQIKPIIYLPIVLVSALTWIMIWISIGYIFGPYWDTKIINIESFKYIIFGFLLFIICVLIIKRIRRKLLARRRVFAANQFK